MSVLNFDLWNAAGCPEPVIVDKQRVFSSAAVLFYGLPRKRLTGSN